MDYTLPRLDSELSHFDSTLLQVESRVSRYLELLLRYPKLIFFGFTLILTCYLNVNTADQTNNRIVLDGRIIGQLRKLE